MVYIRELCWAITDHNRRNRRTGRKQSEDMSVTMPSINWWCNQVEKKERKETTCCDRLWEVLWPSIITFEAALPVLGSGGAMMFSVGGGVVCLFVFLERQERVVDFELADWDVVVTQSSLHICLWWGWGGRCGWGSEGLLVQRVQMMMMRTGPHEER